MASIVEIQNITKKYGAVKAVNNISFTVEQGEILGFLGPNGAGKSTTMNMLTGYISSTSGKIKVCGFDIMDEPNSAKKKIGYLPEQPPLYFDMTVSEYLDFVYELKKADAGKKKSEHLAEIMKTVGIDGVKGRLIKNLSKGYKQRVGLAQALVGDPEVLVLDEPTVGLDPRQIIEIRNVIKKLGRSRTIILSTHILQEVTAICDRVVIINHGKIVAMDTIDNLSGAKGSTRFHVRIKSDEYKVKNIIADVEDIKYSEILGSREPGTVDFIVEAQADTDIREDVFNAFAEKKLPVLMMRPMELTLEEIFIKATSDLPSEEDDEPAISSQEPDSDASEDNGNMTKETEETAEEITKETEEAAEEITNESKEDEE